MVTSPLESTMVQQAGISATPSYHRLGANSLPGLLPPSSSSECLKPQQPQPLWPRCKGDRKVSHTFPHAQVLRETKWKRRRGEGAQDGHTLTLWPFQMLPDHRSICITTHHSSTVKRKVSLEARRVWCHGPQPHTGSAEGLLSQGPLLPPTHTHMLHPDQLCQVVFWSTLSRFLK